MQLYHSAFNSLFRLAAKLKKGSKSGATSPQMVENFQIYHRVEHICEKSVRVDDKPESGADFFNLRFHGNHSVLHCTPGKPL